MMAASSTASEGESAPKFGLRPAAERDAAFVHEVRMLGLRPYVARIWGWDDEVQAARFAARWSPHRYRIVTVDGREVGILSVERRADEVFLADIGLLPDHRGRGVGAALVRVVVAEAAAVGLPVALQVFKISPARRLYERCGFRVVGETDTHYLMRTG